jgi:hypothetical protein
MGDCRMGKVTKRQKDKFSGGQGLSGAPAPLGNNSAAESWWWWWWWWSLTVRKAVVVDGRTAGATRYEVAFWGGVLARSRWTAGPNQSF